MFCAHVNACEHRVYATPDSSVAGQPDPVDGHTVTRSCSASTVLSARFWTFDEAVPSCPQVPSLYAIHARVLDEANRVGFWVQLGFGPPVDSRPLYVGKSEEDLVERNVRDHFSGPSEGSTVRRSLAACSARNSD